MPKIKCERCGEKKKGLPKDYNPLGKDICFDCMMIEINKELGVNMDRLEEVEEFASEVKRICRETGRSRSIDVSELEPLFVKYNIKIK